MSEHISGVNSAHQTRENIHINVRPQTLFFFEVKQKKCAHTIKGVVYA
jgi:hypothetical protein